MKNLLKCSLLAGVVVLAPFGISVASADEDSSTSPEAPSTGAVTPPVTQPSSVPDLPVLPTPVPSKPSNARLSHDRNAIEQLMNVVQISRLIQAGLTDIFNDGLERTRMLGNFSALLDLSNDLNAEQVSATKGPKTIPLFNGAEEISGRQGGTGMHEMAQEAIAGSINEPRGISDTIDTLKPLFLLNDTFDFANDTEGSDRSTTGQGAAKAAVAAGIAEQSYKRTSASMVRLEAYLTALELSPDIKTSVDLNTRVLIEIAQQLNESVRVQAADVSLKSTDILARSASIADDSGFFDFTNYNRD